ncbi:cytidine deaminase [Hydrogenimonas sp. SS33]|uniref:cytidine deaminase n=1 Tax=Hydrogenimonas leucolamina TaxID=2954236 RepID=UPI00336C1C83
MNHFERLERLLDRAYAPYSRFRVAAVAVDSEGNLYEGVNVESAAYPTTMCAERNAIFHAVAAGMAHGTVREVHILARDGEGAFVPAYPCGACRQIIAEQSSKDAEVFVYFSKERVERYTIAELLPHAFTL